MPQPILHSQLATRVDRFVAKTDLARLYKEYSWDRDSHADGFPDILRLEKQLSRGARQKGVTLQDVRDVVAWGGGPSQSRIVGPITVLRPSDLYDDRRQGPPPPGLLLQPLEALLDLRYVGPTYASKVLRFAMPEHYGAIDSWCVRVFGQGDPAAKKQDWLQLQASPSNKSKNRWGILEKKRAGWPHGYGVWLAILRHIASTLAVPCPHPPIFTKEGLRRMGQWTCADVEMALFTYASQQVHAVGR